MMGGSHYYFCRCFADMMLMTTGSKYLTFSVGEREKPFCKNLDF